MRQFSTKLLKRAISAWGNRLPTIWRNPSKLVSANRFDIPAKVIYAKNFFRGTEEGWPTDLYLAHINSFNGFFEKEPAKNCEGDFLNEFNTLLRSVVEQGFDTAVSTIPIGWSDLNFPIN